jgi:hypothetical protein
MSDLVSCKIETANLMAAVELGRAYSKRTPAIAVNTAAYMVARKTFHNMPMATVTRIDTQMQVQTVPVMKIASRGRNKGSLVKSREVAIVHERPISAAMRIVLARMNPMSNFSVLTGNYWALRAPSFSSGAKRIGQGVSAKAQFWDWVEETADRMVKARHSSIAFFKSGWVPAIRALYPHASRSVGGLGGIQNPDAHYNYVPTSGWAIPAPKNAVVATAEIANAIGTAGKNSVLYTKHNESLHAIAPPVLQAAINSEFESTMRYVAEQQWKMDKARYEALGFILN